MEIIKKSTAKEKNLRYYFTGKPCINSHVAPRYCKSSRCVECRKSDYDPGSTREYNAAYRAKNKDELRQYDRDRRSSETAKKQRKDKRQAQKDEFIGPPKPPRSKQSDASIKAKRAAGWARYYEEHRTTLAEKSKVYRSKNRDVVIARTRAWSEKNQHRRTALQQKRDANKLQSVPPWSGEFDDFVWLEAAELVRSRRVATGVSWASDHMIPLACRSARGLHVWNNCQVIPWSMNQSKNNKLILTEPLEWLKYL